MDDRIRISFTNEESDEAGGDVAVAFRLHHNTVWISSYWNRIDDLYGDGCSIRIPERAWRIGLEWVSSRLGGSAEHTAVLAEREACAKIADGELMEVFDASAERVAKSIADQIRARK